MALLDSLQLLGIRSFAPEYDEAQVVEFFSPVTLFLGQNGSGKTTIIEALKYACSGSFPPNCDQGQGFVHDPKITNSATVKGQVKLRFVDAKGETVTISKSMQVSQLRERLKFQSLDQTIKIKGEDGREKTLSSRCGDIENIIFNHFGVSKAVINNVIFCQQDNALWPLEDGKKLKEKFDAIFNIGVYNDAVDDYRKVIKQKKIDLIVCQEGLKYKKERKSEVNKKQQSLIDKKQEVETMQKEITDKSNILVKINDKVEEITTLEQEISEIVSSIAVKESEKNSLRKQQEMLLDSITEEFNGTDEELANEIQTFEKKRETDEKAIENFQNELQQLEGIEQQINDAINKLQVKLGELKEKQQQQECRIEKRDCFISEACSKNGIPHQNKFDNKVIYDLKTFLETLKVNQLEVQRKHRVEERTLQEKINKLREERASTLHDIELKQQDVLETQEKFTEISGQLHDLNVSDEQLNNFLQKMMKIEKELENLTKTFDIDTITDKMKKLKDEIVQFENEQEEYEKERKLLQKNCITEHEIDTKKLLLVKIDSEIKKLKDKHFHSLRTLFGEVPENNFKETLQTRIVETEDKINVNRKELENQQKLFTRVELERKLKNDERKTLKEKFNKNKDIIGRTCRGKPYDVCVNDLYLQIEGLQKDKGENKSIKIMYEKYITHLKKEKCCPVCETGFQDKTQTVNKIINNMSSKIRSLPEDIRQIEEKLAIKQSLHSELLQLKSVNDEITELESQLPDLDKEIEGMEENLKTSQTSLKNLDASLKSAVNDLKLCNAIISDAALIDRHLNELIAIKTDVSNLELQIITVPSNMSLSQIDEKLEDIKEELGTSRKSCESLQKKINQNNERRQQLNQDRNNLKEKQLNLQKAVQGKPLLEDQRIELKKKEDKLKTLIEELKTKEFNITRSLAEEKDNLEMIKSANESENSTNIKEYEKNKKLIDEIVKLQNDIDDYVQLKMEDKFNATKEDLCNLKIKEQSNNVNKKEIARKINDVQRKRDGQSNVFRNLNENLRLRQFRKEEDAVLIEMGDLKKKLKNYDYKSIQEEKNALNKRHLTIEKEIVYVEGNMNEIKRGVQDLENDLNRPENVNAYRDYKKQLYETFLLERIIVDTEKFAKSLEDSIIKYHSNRMKHINSIIKELWQSIYRGNDIEYIQIKTDQSTSTKAKRTYNYKVVQYRNNAELEMSGRCSAGQKVLACLLIRMALAETFSHNCGILALDEPTTNLDRENIESLCDGLFRIINNKQTQKNFQLLIITHDTHFLNTLRNIGACEYYYHVSRNDEGNSVITKQTL